MQRKRESLVGLVIAGNWLDEVKHLGVVVGMLSLAILYALLVAYGLCHPMRDYLERKASAKASGS